MDDETIDNFIDEILEGIPEEDLWFIIGRIEMFEKLIRRLMFDIRQVLNENDETQLLYKHNFIDKFVEGRAYYAETLNICDKFYDYYVNKYKW
jgi:hypothetical protein